MSGSTIGLGWEIRKLAFSILSILNLFCCPGTCWCKTIRIYKVKHFLQKKSSPMITYWLPSKYLWALVTCTTQAVWSTHTNLFTVTYHLSLAEDSPRPLGSPHLEWSGKVVEVILWAINVDSEKVFQCWDGHPVSEWGLDQVLSAEASLTLHCWHWQKEVAPGSFSNGWKGVAVLDSQAADISNSTS